MPGYSALFAEICARGGIQISALAGGMKELATRFAQQLHLGAFSPDSLALQYFVTKKAPDRYPLRPSTHMFFEKAGS